MHRHLSVMRSFVIAIALISPLLLSACAAKVDTAHIAKMDSFIGSSEKQIIQAWGVPDKSYTIDRRTKVISYRKQTFYNDGGSGFGMTTCAGSVGRGIGYSGCIDPWSRPSRTYSYVCDMNFNIVGGKATSWFQNGNGCPRIQ